MSQMVIIFGQLTSHSHFNVWCEVIAASRVHDGNADLENEKPHYDNENNDAQNIWAEYKPENEDNKKSEEWENASHSVFKHIYADAVTEHFGQFLNFYIINSGYY